MVQDVGKEGGYVPRIILVTGGAGFIASHVAIHLAVKYPSYKVSTPSICCFKCVLSGKSSVGGGCLIRNVIL